MASDIAENLSPNVYMSHILEQVLLLKIEVSAEERSCKQSTGKSPYK